MSELRDRVLYVNEPLLDFNNERGNPRGREVRRVDGNPHYRPYRHHRGGQLAGVRVFATRVPAGQERRSLSFQSNKWEV